MKHYLIGTDEAGYGPNLGPLVIACSVWEIGLPETAGMTPPIDYLDEIEKRLGPIVTDKVTKLGKNGKILLIGDSKKLYQSGKLNILAEAILTLLPLFARKPENTRDFVTLLTPDDAAELFSSESGQNFAANLGLSDEDASRDFPETKAIRSALCENGTRLCDIKARVVGTREFNLKLDLLGKKSTLLSETTLALVRQMLDSFSDANVTVLCDKHGARNRYVDMLYQMFPEHGWIEIVTESDASSVYRMSSHDQTVEFRFQAKADRHIPAALASMTAKLLREIVMSGFNHFWRQHVPDLQPTAGYPVDARRFFGQIEKISESMGIKKDDIWRKK